MSRLSNPFAPKPSVSFSEAIQRIRGWTRTAIGVESDVVISVNEMACPEEGCPPRETIIIVMDGGRPRAAVIHKAMADVTESEVAAVFSRPDHTV